MKIFTVILFILITAHLYGSTNDKNKPNVLLILIDDLRPSLSCYGDPVAITPRIQSLADEGIMFTRAYTQQAVCAPSRNTLMTGLRPDELQIYDLKTFFRRKAPGVVTLPQHFKYNGYLAEGMGKVYHLGHGNQNDSLSWSTDHWRPYNLINSRMPVSSGDTVRLHTDKPQVDGKKIAWYVSPLPENMHLDALTTSHAIERIEILKDTTFFLAVGLSKPHLPFVAPKKYWYLYDPEKFTLPDTTQPAGCPAFATTNWGELRKYYNIPPKGLLPPPITRKLIHGYYACISFVDAQVGRIINKLKNEGLFDKTLIILWGDHGFKIGEYGDWCKHTNFELDTRIPLIVKLPLMKHQGTRNNSIVETVDIYPTLCEAAGLEAPEHLQGTSLYNILCDPAMETSDVAFSQYPRTRTINGKRKRLMGMSMRTRDWRYTRWTERETNELITMELYDHRKNDDEMVNLADDPAYKEILQQLDQQFNEAYAKEH